MDKMEEAVNGLLKQQPGYPMGLFTLGQIRKSQGRLDETREIWGKVLAQIPEDRPEYKTLKQQIEALGQ